MAGRRDDGGLSDRLARLPEGHPSALDPDADPGDAAPAQGDLADSAVAEAELAEAELAENSGAAEGGDEAGPAAGPAPGPAQHPGGLGPGRRGAAGNGWSEPLAGRAGYRPWFSGDRAADPWFAAGPGA
jgi:hypothetical protein